MKKNIGLLSACVLLVCGICSRQSYAQASLLGNSDYLIYNVESHEITYHAFDEVSEVTGGEVSPGYFPEEIVVSEYDEGASTFAIVGKDDERDVVNPTNVGPYCNTVYLEVFFNGSDEPSIVSGFMLGPSAVLTCAHCVYDRGSNGNNGKGLATSVRVVPAKNGSEEPYGSANSINIAVAAGYLNNGASEHDWAIIEIDQPLGNLTGWLGLRWQEASYVGTQIENTGYPAKENCKKQNNDDTLMLVGKGEIKWNDSSFLHGDWDATGGNSGGPVFTYYPEYGHVAIGILSNGSIISYDEYPTAYSGVLRITQDMFNTFMKYR